MIATKPSSKHSFAPILALVAMLGCRLTPDTAPADATTAHAAPSEAVSGGLLYDRWTAVARIGESFQVGERGGPNGDGTLNSGAGSPIEPAGHGYRFKSLFGWDLRGAQGVYGPGYQNKESVLPTNLLEDTRTVDELTRWFAEGDDVLPAYGAVLTQPELRAVAEFVVEVREHRLPHPDQIWALSDAAPKSYVLNAGADPEVGARLYAGKCAACHGEDGAAMTIEETHTLGSFVRTSAYEAWIKVVSGAPGTPMGPQSRDAGEILAIFAALCDRTRFPARGEDVPDGDLRCGAYLR